MNDPAVYPRPVPLSQEDSLALAATVGQWPDVPGTFIVFEYLGLEERDGEWRFVGATHSLAGVFDRLAEFHLAFGVDEAHARESVAGLLRSTVLGIFQRLEDGDTARYCLAPEVPAAHRVVFLAEAQAPHENHGLCILEIEPEDAGPFVARKPEAHWPEQWFERDQWVQQRSLERCHHELSARPNPEPPASGGDSEPIPF